MVRGSPPRARGRLILWLGGTRTERFTPAGAGTAWTSTSTCLAATVHPRGRGDGSSARGWRR